MKYKTSALPSFVFSRTFIHNEVSNFLSFIVSLRYAWNDLKISVEKYDKHNFVDFFNFDVI